MDCHGKTSLTVACKYSKDAYIDLLMEYGANPNCTPENEHLFSPPLHQVFYTGNSECLAKLLQLKPDTSFRKDGALAIEFVFKLDKNYMFDFLLNYKEIKTLINEDPNLTVNNENINWYFH